MHRSTLHCQAQPDPNADLSARLQALAAKHKRWGFRKAWAIVRRAGQRINKKRVHRLWVRENLQVKQRAGKKRSPPGESAPPVKAQRPNHVWTYDFVHDACHSGTKFRCLTVVDEFTRECLRIEVATRFTATQVIAVLHDLFARYGAPDFVRSDNGPEFIAGVAGLPTNPNALY